MKKILLKIKNIFKLIYRSIELDVAFLQIQMQLIEKIMFIYKKYFFLFKNYFFGFTVYESYMMIFGSRYYFEDVFGSSFLQSVYVDNAMLSKFIKPDSVIVDVGANIGQFAFFSKHFLKAKKIYSFEPAKNIYKLLELNSANPIFNYAISEKKEIQFFVPKCTSLMSSIFKYEDDDICETVKGVRLDDVIEIRNEKFIDLLKIDTEGSEFSVLKVSLDTLRKSRYILVELSLNRPSSGSFMDSICFLKENIPTIDVVHIGRQYTDNDKGIAVDVLFKNKALFEHL